jgi:hypothetical protein
MNLGVMMYKNLYEIFEEFEERKTKSDKIAVLRYNGNYALRTILQGTFNPNVKFAIEAPDYKPSDSPIGMGYSHLIEACHKLYLFEEGNAKAPQGLTNERRKQLLIQILESLEAKEASLLQGMFRKKLPVKGLTYAIVKEAFPDLVP